MKRKQSGFTLIELLVTIFVLAIGLGTIFALVTMTADLSRQHLNERKLQRFSETVFTTVDWALSVDPNGDPDPWTVPVMTEGGERAQVLRADGEEAEWPVRGSEPERIPRIVYQLVLSTNSATGIVEADLSVRMQSELEWTEFEREFSPQRGLW
jgi:prepilin-type N-terminal cleavage/methylation domain-containing protein